MTPTPEELKRAVEVAERMRARDEDPEFVARSLLHLHHRSIHLEKVFKAAERYLHSGLAEHEHSELIRAIDLARRADLEESHQEDVPFGLD